MKAADLETLNMLRAERKAAVVLTGLAAGETRIVREDEAIDGDLGEHVSRAFRTGKSATVSIDGNEWFLNAHLPPPRVVVVGAVHISQALVPMAKLAGYDIEIVDPRTAFATAERFPEVAVHAEWPEDVLKQRPLDAYCALVAVTHDPKIDDHPLQAAISAGCFYVGALGSRKTHGKRLDRLHASGLSQEETCRIRAPIGLDIGASSPSEIAVAIMAEIIQAFRTRGM